MSINNSNSSGEPDMKYGINLQSILPVRISPDETGEQVTQLLFGEIFKVIETIPGRHKIENYADDYVGWVDAKMINFLSEDEYTAISNGCPHSVYSSFAKIRSTESHEVMYLTKGSWLHFFDKEKKRFGIGNRTYECLEGEFLLPSENPNPLIQTAKSFLNVPYLWGGKNIFGIDCSGFVQIVFGLHGLSLPRDAKDQFEKGEFVLFPNVKEGDLAFFENDEGKIVHVGIIMNKNQIIHASGKVKTDTLDAFGIYSSDFQKYTHTLAGIKRIWKNGSPVPNYCWGKTGRMS